MKQINLEIRQINEGYVLDDSYMQDESFFENFEDALSMAKARFKSWHNDITAEN